MAVIARNAHGILHYDRCRFFRVVDGERTMSEDEARAQLKGCESDGCRVCGTVKLDPEVE